ncbi:Acetyltransferase (GNAT) family [Bergeyella zoohelcum]|uniref:Uncharacterized protein n=3 Tax=Bergeyella zoohelcum TaxID=1015 RepID=K1LRG5_9FLAO|nr:hypothetical protein HMPREF9699_00144 [Bergeyella zoohelcum ATCC 43767]SUV49681.1 Acetyltransferase (GNAT) family [Bergeyella zoohelcum]VDH03986.1 Acetyltransferase (GNAT) family [Bergeyella zoohelcum]
MIFDINKKKRIMRYENQRQGNGGVILLFSDENIEIGRCTYMVIPSESKLIISFVLVHKEFEGKGMGKLLVEAAIQFARENGWKIFPHCSYAHSVMKKIDHVKDILIPH